MIEQISINKIKNNELNPRNISDDKLEKLKKSITDFPQMLKLRPIVINDKNVVLGGNMRLKACTELGHKKAWIIRAEKLTKKQQEQFIIKDNVGFGVWDYKMLDAEFNSEKLNDWGLDFWNENEEIDYSVLDDIELGTELENMQNEVKKGILIEFNNTEYEIAFKLITQARQNKKNIGQIVINALKNA